MVKKLLILPGIILGVGVMIFLSKTKLEPKRAEIVERSKAVKAVNVQQMDFIPRAVGYGYVQPEKVWEAVAEIKGKIVKMHPNLKKGVFLKKGEFLFRIEPETSRLAVEGIEADILNIQAQIAKIDQNLDDTERQRNIESKSLDISKSELERKQKLFDEGIISKSELDKEKQSLLVQKNVVENFKGTLNSIPSERRALMANLASQKAKLKDARINVGRTEIFAQFDSRVSKIDVELGQAVSVGEILATADSVAVAEINAQIPRYQLTNLILKDANPSVTIESLRNITDGDQGNYLNFGAIVRIDPQGKPIEWPARFSRFTEIDPKTGTIGVVVSVDDPYLTAQPGIRPPLQKNFFCEVEIFAKARPDSIVIPRSSIHENIVYRVTSDERLEKKEVKIDFFQGNVAVIKSGIKAGDRVIVSDVIPAIDGMLLAVQMENSFIASLTQSPKPSFKSQ
jgi:multidrug efflux pump subunit AcrA (membrane-fusion protein)